MSHPDPMFDPENVKAEDEALLQADIEEDSKPWGNMSVMEHAQSIFDQTKDLERKMNEAGMPTE